MELQPLASRQKQSLQLRKPRDWTDSEPKWAMMVCTADQETRLPWDLFWLEGWHQKEDEF